jgi:hypothetical protein
MTERNVSPAATRDVPATNSNNAPVLFVVDQDTTALEVLLADLSRRFCNDFTASGTTSPNATLTRLA